MDDARMRARIHRKNQPTKIQAPHCTRRLKKKKRHRRASMPPSRGALCVRVRIIASACPPSATEGAAALLWCYPSKRTGNLGVRPAHREGVQYRPSSPPGVSGLAGKAPQKKHSTAQQIGQHGSRPAGHPVQPCTSIPSTPMRITQIHAIGAGSHRTSRCKGRVRILHLRTTLRASQDEAPPPQAPRR